MKIGRLTTQYKLAGTEMFRLASSRLLGFHGTNLQNPSESVMECVIPDDGCVFVQPDQGGAEALIVAMECRRARFRKLFENNIKPHSYMALQIFTEKFRGEYPASRYKMVDPDVLASYEECKQLMHTIKENPREYQLGKKTIHCVTPDHEVLTLQGWERIDKLPQDIAVWSPRTHSITFEEPTWNVGNYSGNMLHFKTSALSQIVTPTHTIPLIANGKLKTFPAHKAIRYKGGCVPTAGFVDGFIQTDPLFARLLVAIQADGCILSTTTVKFRFKKLRKVRRMKWLLSCMGFSYNYYQSEVDRVHNITCGAFGSIIEMLGKEKNFGPWLLSWNAEALDAFIDELKYWDGVYTEEYLHKREAYVTTNHNNADWVKTILHLRGKRGGITGKDLYQVGISNRQKSLVTGASIVQYDGPVYCPTVSTGFFLVRHNGQISVTGNSKNYKMGPRTFQVNVLEESGGTIVLSYKESKEFLSIHELTFPEIVEWQAEIEGRVGAERCLRNLFGYPRRFDRLWSDELIRQACAFIPQSTVGTITNIAYTELFERIKREHLPWYLLNNKHDSLLLQVPDTTEHIDLAIAYSKEHMGRELVSSRGEHYRMKVGISVGHNWGHWSETNPQGMKEL